MALRRFDLEVVRRWVEESCAAQGVVVKVARPEAVERAAALLREGRRPHRPGEGGPDA
ncbi:MAG: hypothetical protein WEA29_06105 [Acidimicrobiia bacterium]